MQSAEMAGLEIDPSSYPDPRRKTVYWHTKRAFDIALSLVLLCPALPVLAISALAIRLETPGPVFFRQSRRGLDGRAFSMIKLRTMRVGMAQPQAPDGTLLKPENDPRITRVGRLLRVSSIDELPQLLNVLAGHMSLVGPRPLVPHMLAPFPGLAEVRCRVRPGVTGLWQIRNRAQATHVKFMAAHDLEYIERFSLGLDLGILLHTPLRVLLGTGAR